MRLSERTKTALRWMARAAVFVGGATVVAVLFWLREGIYNHYSRYPKQAAAWAAIRADRKPVEAPSDWQEFKGVLHSHSHLSHDSEVPFEDILKALHQAERDFICLSDHCVDGRADFDTQWRGLHEGKLFIPGFEMKGGFMAIGVRSGVVLTNETEPATLAAQIVEQGGLLFYAHPEEPRGWHRPELTGMEIYNIHADLKDEGGLSRLLPDLLINHGKFPEQVLRSIFDRPEANLRRWDDLNRKRHLTGIAGNDCHQNTGLRLISTAADTLRLEDTSPKRLAEWKLNFLTRPLAKAWFGPLSAGRQLWSVQLDPYARMLKYVSTHLLARELTEEAVLGALKAGRAFVGFDLVADSTGFVWRGQNGAERAVMGENLTWSPEARLFAAAPHHCRFTVVQDGGKVFKREGREMEWTPPGPGRYRVEAELRVGYEWIPWVYTNPIWIYAAEKQTNETVTPAVPATEAVPPPPPQESPVPESPVPESTEQPLPE